MALLFMDSFDHYATANLLEKWSVLTPGSADISGIGAVGRRSTSGFKLALGSGAYGNNYSISLARTFAATSNTLVFGVAFRPVSSFSTLSQGQNADVIASGASTCPACLMYVRNLGVGQFWLRVNANGTISAMRQGNPSVSLGTTSSSLIGSAYTYVEVMVTIHDTAGSVIIHFNGNEVLNVPGVNTRGGTVNAWNEIRLGAFSPNASITLFEWNYDDLYVLDGSGSAPWNTFLGDCRVDALMPTAEGASSAWTPDAAHSSETNNALLVDDPTADADATYVSTVTSGAKDTYVVPDAPVVGATIYGVQVCVSARKEDAGTFPISAVVRHAGTDYVQAMPNPGTTYAYQTAVFPTNPGTSAAWTEAGFNAAEFGFVRG